MKNSFLILAIVSCFLFSCDYVDVPVPSSSTSGGADTFLTRKILIEDYTGHKCHNCPPAAATIEQIKNKYGSKIISIGIHAGGLADPVAGSASLYKYDFRTTTGTAYYDFFQINASGGIPKGMVNRIGYSSTTSPLLDYGNWSSFVENIIHDSAKVDLKISNSYDSGSRSLNTTIKSRFLNVLSGDDFKLVVLLTEDSIVATQLMPDGVTPQDSIHYLHHFALRDVINNTWGDTIVGVASTTNTTDTIINNYPSYLLNSTWNQDQCYIVAFIYKYSNYEILQVDQKKIK